MRVRLLLSLLFVPACAAPPPVDDVRVEPLTALGPPLGQVGGLVTGLTAFGSAVGRAGDVDGDGFGDLLVMDSFRSRVYLYLGGPSGPAAAPVWDIGLIGVSHVGAAGDVNGDGFGDAMIGASGANANQGMAWLFLGSATGLGSAAWSGAGAASYTLYGADGAAGDFNGDGYSDWVVGASRETINAADQGACTIYFGGPTFPSATQLLLGAGAQTRFGRQVSNAGDVNADGYDDLLVGSQEAGGGAGSAWVYLGGPGGLTTTPSWSRVNVGSGFGAKATGAGDLNGDGFADIAVGSALTTALDVYLGTAAGPAATSIPLYNSWWGGGDTLHGLGDVNGDGYGDLLATWEDGGRLYYGGPSGPVVFEGLSPGAAGTDYGEASGPGGDINGDGFADLVIGAPEDSAHTNQGGAVYVVLGGPAGRSIAPQQLLVGNYNGSDFGYAVEADADVNGDGFDDIVMTAPLESNGGANSGASYFTTGGAGGLDTTPALTFSHPSNWATYGRSVSHLGDIDGDGFSDVAVGCPGCGSSNAGAVHVFLGTATGIVPGVADQVLVGPASGMELGRRVSGGDFNGDGYADLAASAPQYSGDQSAEGAVLVWHGGPAGFSAAADWLVEPAISGSNFGSALDARGDLTGDGYADLLVGAPSDAASLLGEGKVYLYLGGPGGLDTTAAWEVAGGQTGALFGQWVAWVDDLQNDGFADVAVTSLLYDGAAADVGALFVFYGGPSSPSLVADWSEIGTESGAYAGLSVTGTGGIGGGYPGLAWGAPLATSPSSLSGAIDEFVGGTSGVQGQPVSELDGPIQSAELGFGLSAGDLDGDGFFDLVGGATGTTSATASGGVYLWYGNRGVVDQPASWAPRPFMRDVGAATALPKGAVTASQTEVELVMQLGSPYGRTEGVLEYEIKPVGAPWDAADATFDSTAWTVVGCPICLNPAVPEFVQLVGGLAPETPHRWRARVRWDPASNPTVPASRWFYGGRRGASEGLHFRTALADVDADGFGGSADDCDDNDATVYPGAVEACNGVDEDCDALVDEDFDLDLDTFFDGADPGCVTVYGSVDCDDAVAAVFPGATELCDLLDGDCDGAVDEDFDLDGDGYMAGTGCAAVYADLDCDDDATTGPGVYPTASELCDAIDSNCDGSLLDGFSDIDGDLLPDCIDGDADGDGDPASTDCDDADPLRYSGAPETCDALDSNCNGSLVDGDPDNDNDGEPDCIDPDDDGDGALDEDDCDDQDPGVFPGASELCDGVDQDCDGDLVESFPDGDGDGTPDCVDPDADGDGYGGPASDAFIDCDDGDPTIYPGADEVCDGADSDCDGVVDPDEDDDDGDGWFPCNGDCDDIDPDANPGQADDDCDGIDDDCDGVADQAAESFDWYADADGDAYGSAAVPHPGNPLCASPGAGWSQLSTDCDDAESSAHPDGTEVPGNGIDEDCDGVALGAPGGGGEAVAAPGCSCDAAQAGAGAGPVVLLSVAVLWRRRR